MSTTLLRGLRPASLYPRAQFTSRALHIRLASSTTTTSHGKTTKPIARPSPSYNSSNKKNTSNTPSAPRTTPTTTTNATSTTPSSSSTSPLNGPATTHPSPLNTPVRQPNQPFFFKYAFQLGKSYALFYKSGVKAIWTNYNLAQPIQKRIDSKHNFSLPAAVAARALSRAELQLLRRNSHDVRRVPLFGLVFLICGEFTPLVVIALSSVVPWTCRIPKQITADRRKLEKRRAISFRNLTDPPPPTSHSHSPATDSPSIVSTLSRQQLLHISWSLGLSSSIWDYLGGRLPGLPTFILRRKVAKHVQYLEMDDALIQASGAPLSGMEVEEVRMALVERGVDVLDVGEERLRAALGAWLKSREKTGVEALLLTRPSVWPVQPPGTASSKQSPPTPSSEKTKL